MSMDKTTTTELQISTCSHQHSVKHTVYCKLIVILQYCPIKVGKEVSVGHTSLLQRGKKCLGDATRRVGGG